jgi:hypothetical protein
MKCEIKCEVSGARCQVLRREAARRYLPAPRSFSEGGTL